MFFSQSFFKVALVVILIAFAFGVGTFFDVKIKNPSQPKLTPTRIQKISLAPEIVITKLPEQKTLNPQVKTGGDPLVECKNSNCGSIMIKKSLCSDTSGYVCCQVKDRWVWYSSRDQCYEDQKTVQNTTNTAINSDPVISCILDWGTYQLPKSVCDGYKKAPKITP